ncbi:protein rolling stone-like [Sitodiplosis mosellana]|uniref:protein rolling stone-like n=1 Tax=Sitodiplosis mosellana TaxID=263140 RepID=UPI002444067B|nr:protein rolling stone-like [Sitodiplosis mosellana]XP_055301377.1 protein rolling stone-like [Sitodiplosis mosellana]
MSNKMIKTYKKELKLSNCGFDHDPVDSMVRSQWQSRSKNNFYLVYRWLVAIFVIAVVIVSMFSHVEKYSFGLFFIYLTHWGILINMVVGVFGAILVTVWHFHSDFKENVLKNSEMPTAFKIYWALHNIALITSFAVTIIYWSILHNDKIPLNAPNILSHAMNSVIMFLDILIVAYPLRLYHVIQPICFGVSYGIFSFIYYLCGGVNILGNPYIYNVLNWNEPGKAMVTVFGTLILAIIVHVTLFWIYKLRVFVQRRYFSTQLILPTKVPKQQRLNSSLGSQISMVFGGDDGCTNDAFKISSEKMCK